MYLSNEEKLPIWLCAVPPEMIYAGVAVTISEFDKDSKFMGSTLIFLDDRKTCLETEAPLSSEGHLLIEMSGDTSYMEQPTPVPLKIELNLNGAITKTIIECKWQILTQVLATALLRSILSNPAVANSPLKMASENQRKVALVILFLKNFEQVRIERIIVVSLVFSAAEVAVTLWYLLLPRRPLFMALLQLAATMGLKYAFIGDDGIVAFFKQFDFSPSGLTGDMSQDMRETLCDIGIVFYALIGLIGSCLCSSKKSDSENKKLDKVEFAEDKKEKEEE